MGATLELQQSVQSSLQNLKNLDALKRLFWSQLNYERENKALSRRKLTDAVTNEVEGEPLLLASGGVNKDFHVIYSRLKTENLSRQSERVVVNHLLQEHPYALFIFSNKSQSRWHFLNVKYDSSPQKRRLFRRITVGEGEQLRTATERISLLDLESIPDASPLDIQTRHDEAFDVEAVTQEFFREYRKTFEKIENLIKWATDSESKRLFTQKLFNRLMFIAFIEKKGWLKFQKRTDYLSALWESYQHEDGVSDKNFYRDRLSHLFFSGLNNPQEQDITGINNGGFLKELIGSVPYLNGGLFEQGEDEKNPQFIIPDDCIDTILHDLFQRFAFTVTESTPLDVEVAVDPEMLGKVFEELVTGRHESGSYYTPKPIVSFMCREALKGYLKTQVANESHDAVAEFVDEHNPNHLVNSEAILEALRKVRCCDLAAGSGAYLLGMLHELLDLRQCLFANKGLDSNTVYQRKLEIIENNIYGIDKDVFAVNIARLRLWLSLAVEYQGEKPNPLPNLKYKIEVGDSLTAPSPATTGVIRDELISQYSQKKAEYMRTHEGGKKQKLEDEINELKTQITLITNGSIKTPEGFDWAVEFAEVFADGGFDIQVANPPYVRQELIKDLKPTLQKIYPTTYNGTSDLYCFFYARGLQLLKSGGMLSFISSNKWFRAKYGEKLKKHIADTCQVHSITDFGDLPVFQSAAVLVMIFVAQNQKSNDILPTFTQVKSLKSPYPDVKQIIQDSGHVLPSDALKGENWTLTDTTSVNRLRKMEAVGVPLGEYVNGHIYYGVKTGFNKAFVIDGAKRAELITQDPKSAEIIKPLTVGDDIRKWRVNYKDKWFIYSPWNLKIDNYPAVKNHLTQWVQELKARPECREGRYNWWCMARYGAEYVDAFNQPKIIYPVIAKESRFALDTKGAFTNDKAFIIPIPELYLLGILNSSIIWEYLKSQCSELLGKSLELRSIYMNKIPIPNASTTDRQVISKLVQKCLDAKGLECEAWEKEIDERVAALYGL
ncbi:TaqI-like C-terminal specificity domain-containing protein [Nostoc sp. 106C]|uniref:Eco57I restriction-modification methylase domain-containing protein n=1 Tax=Nostoc sp. 106C TaxID=1932667 RepID=UPI000A3C1D10|nr:TaqI-like C-terminal specificity domain-containing protein [Nostoc sp. 106C]OUL27441.1 type I restriction endonuclease subunit M [Nostoc sp. 106C]